jgi:hypothetical protein
MGMAKMPLAKLGWLLMELHRRRPPSPMNSSAGKATKEMGAKERQHQKQEPANEPPESPSQLASQLRVNGIALLLNI